MRRALLTAISVASVNVWTWPAETVSASTVGVSDGVVLPDASTVAVTYSFHLVNNQSSIGMTFRLQMVSTSTGSKTDIATTTYAPRQSSTWSGTVTGVVIPSGGYSLALNNGGVPGGQISGTGGIATLH